MRFIGGNAIGSFLVKYFQAAFPSHNKDYSVVNAVVIGVGGALSSAGGGYLADFLSRKHGYHVSDCEAPSRTCLVFKGW